MSDIISEQSAESLVVKDDLPSGDDCSESERSDWWLSDRRHCHRGALAPLLTSLDPTEINPRSRNKPPGYETFIRDDDGNKIPIVAHMGVRTASVATSIRVWCTGHVFR